MKYNDLRTQAGILMREFHPGIFDVIDWDAPPPPLPEGAERHFIVPSWRKVASTYPDACRIALDRLARARGPGFSNSLGGEVDVEHLRQLAPRDLHGVVAAQLGAKHGGKSVNYVRGVAASEDGGECLLGVFEVAVILLSNPEVKYEGEWWGIDCAGDEWSPVGGGSFSRAPNFFFDDGLKFGAGVVSVVRDRFGSASGFVPQSNLETRPLGPSDPSGLDARVSALEARMERVLEVINIK